MNEIIQSDSDFKLSELKHLSFKTLNLILSLTKDKAETRRRRRLIFWFQTHVHYVENDQLDSMSTENISQITEHFTKLKNRIR